MNVNHRLYIKIDVNSGFLKPEETIFGGEAGAEEE